MKASHSLRTDGEQGLEDCDDVRLVGPADEALRNVLPPQRLGDKPLQEGRVLLPGGRGLRDGHEPDPHY